MLLRRNVLAGIALLHLRMTSTASFVKPDSAGFIGARLAKDIDERLMSSSGGFSIDQLMELAGYSVAAASIDFFQNSKRLTSRSDHEVLVVCGPGNNGGDGLVAARHLKHFGFQPTVIYPKQGKGQLFVNLVKQLDNLQIPIRQEPPVNIERFSFALDALFGFSFTGPPRQPYNNIIQALVASEVPVVSVDIPSGWDVENGDIHGINFIPAAVVSLTVPKLCMRGYMGVHYIGGRQAISAP
jgi:NAD(P)H-hydrate epimerase